MGTKPDETSKTTELQKLRTRARYLLTNGSSVPETAKEVGRTERTIRNWIEKGGWQADVDAAHDTSARRAAAKQRAVWIGRKAEEADAAGIEASLVRRRIHDLLPLVGTVVPEVETSESVSADGEVSKFEKRSWRPAFTGQELKHLATTYGILVDKADKLSGVLDDKADPDRMNESQVETAIMELVGQLEARAGALPVEGEWGPVDV